MSQPDDPGEYRFTEQEISAVLKQALKRQEAAREAEAEAHESLSLEELERIAAEAGIDVEHVRMAALELKRKQAAGSSGSLWGEVQEIVVEHMIDGPLTNDRWVAIVTDARRLYDTPGRTDQVGSMREWHADLQQASSPRPHQHSRRSSSTPDRIHLTAQEITDPSGRPRTHLRISRRNKGTIASAYGLSIFGGVSALMLLTGLGLLSGALVPSLLVSLLSAGVVFLIARFGIHRVADKQRRKMEELLDGFDRLSVPRQERAAPEPTADTTPTPLINLDDAANEAPDPDLNTTRPRTQTS